MSNNLNTNPILIDTFSADVIISREPVVVTDIIFWSTAANDVLSLDDKDGNLVLYYMLATGKDTRHIHFGKGGRVFQNGLVLDVSDGVYTTASKLLIYVG